MRERKKEKEKRKKEKEIKKRYLMSNLQSSKPF
jgi:hypothetical protein